MNDDFTESREDDNEGTEWALGFKAGDTLVGCDPRNKGMRLYLHNDPPARTQINSRKGNLRGVNVTLLETGDHKNAQYLERYRELGPTSIDTIYVEVLSAINDDRSRKGEKPSKFHHLFVLNGLKRVEQRIHESVIPEEGSEDHYLPRQPDPLRRKMVEVAAVEHVTRHFRERNYRVKSVELDNVGWDLEATRGLEILRLEVKGLSGSAARIELTPNEYAKLNSNLDSYRVCIVCDAVTSPRLSVFSYSAERNSWGDDFGHVLHFEEAVAARAYCSEASLRRN